MAAQPNATAESNLSDSPKVKGNIMITLTFLKDPSPKQDQVCIMLHNGTDPPLILDAQPLQTITPQYLLQQAIAYQERLPSLRLDHSTQSIKARTRPKSVQSSIEPTTQTTAPTATKRKLF
jgi:hypothetical protein